MISSEDRRKSRAAARTYLEMRGFKITEQDWRQSSHHIDIIATKNNEVHFIKVVYTKIANSEQQEFLTSTQDIKDQKAHRSWLEDSKWSGVSHSARLELTGPTYTVMSFVEN